MGLYFFNKNKQKFIFIYFVIAILSIAYIVNSYMSIKKDCRTYTKSELVMNYELYNKIYKLHGSTKNILIENQDYVNNLDLVDEYSKSTPLFINKKQKEISKYSITFKFFKNKDNYTKPIKKMISELGDSEYKIYIDDNNINLFGGVEDVGFVLIGKQINNYYLRDKIFEFFVEIIVFLLVNLFLFFFLIVMYKSLQDDKFYMEREYKYLKEDTKKLAFEDRLTGAASRLKFDETLKDLIQLSSRFEEQKFCLVIIDIDNFKSVNDTYGHDVGDVVIKNISKLLKQSVRVTDIVGRWGGEEFIIIAIETNYKDAMNLAQNIRKSIQSYKHDKVGFKTASFGVTTYKKGDSEELMLNRADSALYKAKNDGRNQVCLSL